MNSYGQYSYTPAPIGNGSLVTNGQILGVPMAGQFFPDMASAPFVKGSGQPPPTVPINYMQGNQTAMGNPQAMIAAANPFSPTMSPLIFAVGALIIGILGLRYIHWR